MQLLLHIGMLRQQIPCPCEQESDCLMPCYQQGYHFIMNLLIAHSLSRLLISRCEEEREQIFPRFVLLATLGDERMNLAIKCLTCILEATTFAQEQMKQWIGSRKNCGK